MLVHYDARKKGDCTSLFLGCNIGLEAVSRSQRAIDDRAQLQDGTTGCGAVRGWTGARENGEQGTGDAH